MSSVNTSLKLESITTRLIFTTRRITKIAYRYLPTKVSKQIVRRVAETWKAWCRALKDWSGHPEKYLGKPKIPGYKHKERGRNVVIYPKDAISSPLLSRGIVKLSQTNIELTTEANNINQVRIVPKLDHYVIEIV